MPHATATFNGQVVAESDTYQTVEGNIYVRIPQFTSDLFSLHYQLMTATKVSPFLADFPISLHTKYPDDLLPLERDSVVL